MAYFKVTWQVEVDAENHFEAAQKGMAARLDQGADDHDYIVDDGHMPALIELGA